MMVKVLFQLNTTNIMAHKDNVLQVNLLSRRDYESRW